MLKFILPHYIVVLTLTFSLASFAAAPTTRGARTPAPNAKLTPAPAGTPATRTAPRATGARFSQAQGGAAAASAPRAPTARGTRVEPDIKVTYVTCAGYRYKDRLPANAWFGDYQGKFLFQMVGGGVDEVSRDVYTEVTPTFTKSPDGKTCNVALSNGRGTLNFQFPLANPESVKKVDAVNARCSGYKTGSTTEFNACIKPPIKTHPTMDARCLTMQKSPVELAYTCDLVGGYIKSEARTFSSRLCKDQPGSEKHVDNICVAHVRCHHRQVATKAVWEAVKDKPKVYDSYVSCRETFDGTCPATADACRADKSIYFTNKETGEATIYAALDAHDRQTATAAPAAAATPAQTYEPATSLPDELPLNTPIGSPAATAATPAPVAAPRPAAPARQRQRPANTWLGDSPAAQ